MRCLRTKMKRDGPERLLASTNGKEMLVKPRLVMVVKQSPCPLHTMSAHQKVPTIAIAHQRSDTSLVDSNVDRIKPANNLVGNFARFLFAADSDIAAKLPEPREPRDKHDRCN